LTRALLFSHLIKTWLFYLISVILCILSVLDWTFLISGKISLEISIAAAANKNGRTPRSFAWMRRIDAGGKGPG